MNEHLLPGEDRETFTTSEDMIENETTSISVVEDEPKHAVAHSKLSNSIYWTYSNKKKKKSKKKKRKSKKKEKDYPVIPQRHILSLFEQQMFGTENIIRKGNVIPDSLIFDRFHESAFYFGRTIGGHFVGKCSEDDGHILIIGGSGSGKTTGIAIPTTLTWKGTIFSFDFKGDLIKWCRKRRRKILYMISGQTNRYWYDPFHFLRVNGDENLIQNARELAQAIIPMPNHINDPFWIESARDVLTGAIVYYYRLGKDFIGTILEIKTTKMSDLLQKINTDEKAKLCVNPDLDLSQKTLAGVSMELHNQISVFATDPLVQDVLSSNEESSKELIQWEDLEYGDIFIRIDQCRIEQWKCVMRLMLVQLIRTLERRPEKHEAAGACVKPTLLMLDEFPQYGKIDAITSSLKILRSKNTTVAMFCQSIADLDETYGEATRRTILDNCPYKAILNASDAETQLFFSNLVGTVNAPYKGVSTNYDESGQASGYSLSINETRKPIIYPHEFAALSDVVLLHPGPERFCRLKKETAFRRSPE